MNVESSHSGMLSNRSMPPGTIIPVLAYHDVGVAVAWLCETFGFKERLRIGNHRSQLVFGEASVVVVAQSGGDSPASAEKPSRQGEATHSIMVRVADVAGHYERARRKTVRILSSPETYPYGERQYTVEDLGGHRWTFTQSVVDVAPETWGGELR